MKLDIAMFSVAINGLKAISTLHYKSSFIEHIAIGQSNEDARVRASDVFEMSQVIQPKASKMGMSLNFSLDPLATES